MCLIGKINIDIYKCITNDIVTDEVIITDNQIQHIIERHPNVYEHVIGFLGEAVAYPDYIIRDKRPNTGLVIKKVQLEDKYVQLVLRVCTSKDSPGYKNSALSCWEISESRLNNYLRNKTILYRKV